MGILFAVVSLFGWGAGDFLAAVSSKKIGNFVTYFWMQIVGFVIATVYLVLNFTSFNWVEVVPHLHILLLVALFQVVAYLSFYKGLSEDQVSVVSPIGSTFSAVIVLLSVIFYSEKLSLSQTAAVLLILVSVVGISLDFEELRKTKKVGVIAGVKNGFVASLGWGISLFLIVQSSRALGWFLPVYLFRLMVLIFLPIIASIQKQGLDLRGNTKLLPVIIGTGLLDITAFFAYSLGVTTEYASIVASVSGAFTAVTVTLALIFFKERLKIIQALSVFGVVLGIILISR